VCVSVCASISKYEFFLLKSPFLCSGNSTVSPLTISKCNLTMKTSLRIVYLDYLVILLSWVTWGDITHLLLTQYMNHCNSNFTVYKAKIKVVILSPG